MKKMTAAAYDAILQGGFLVPHKSPVRWDERRPLVEFTSPPGCHETVCFWCNLTFNRHLGDCPECALAEGLRKRVLAAYAVAFDRAVFGGE